MADREPLPTTDMLPPIDDAVLVEISGCQGLTQGELWEAVGQAGLGNLAAWALTEAERLQAGGTTPQDAFLGGVGYAILALTRQLNRDNDKEKMAALWATFSDSSIAKGA